MATLRAQLRGTIGAVTSRGPGYEPQPLNPAAAYDRVAGYFLDLREKSVALLAPRTNARGEVHLPGPTAIAQRALGFHQWSLAGRAEFREHMLAEIDTLLARATERDAVLIWGYRQPVPKYGIAPPWCSCMSQGQSASALTRAALETGEQRYADAAHAALAALHDPALGLSAAGELGPAFEEVPSRPTSRILNGWIFALWGLWDAGIGLDTPAHLEQFAASAAELARVLPAYDLGWWSRYSLYEPQAPDLAKPFYHRIHCAQLAALGRLTGDAVFTQTAERWRAADTRANRARAVALAGILRARELAWPR